MHEGTCEHIYASGVQFYNRIRQIGLNLMSLLISAVNVSIRYLKDANCDQKPGHRLLPFLRHMAPLTMDTAGLIYPLLMCFNHMKS